jgi:hypothetical protein
VQELGDLFEQVHDAGNPHPWEGFDPRLSVPGDEVAVTGILSQVRTALEVSSRQAAELTFFIQTGREPSINELAGWAQQLEKIPAVPDNMVRDILPHLFEARDPDGETSGTLIRWLGERLASARENRKASEQVLLHDHPIAPADAAKLHERAKPLLARASFDLPLSRLKVLSVELRSSLDAFKVASAAPGRFQWARVTDSTDGQLQDCLASLAVQGGNRT